MFAEWASNQISIHAPGFWLVTSLMLGLGVLYAERVWTPGQWRTLWTIHRLLIPYLGLLLGGLSPRLLGLTLVDWSTGLRVGLILIFAVVGLLFLVRATVDLPEPTQELSRRRGAVPPSRRAADRAGWLQTVTGTIAMAGVREFHWAFLRGAIWELLLTLPVPPTLPGYWAIWLAAGLVLVEVLLRRLSFAPTIFHLVILICTTILFFYTRNFWLCWLLHALAQLIAAPAVLRPALPPLPWGRATR